MKIVHKGKDITELIPSISWSGDTKQVARVLKFSTVDGNKFKDIPNVNFKMGDTVFLTDGNDREYFRGFVFASDRSIQSNVKSVTAYDGLIYLLKSRGTYNFKKMTPGAITRKMCSDFGIPAGDIIEGQPLNRIFDGESIYNIIMTAYTIESDRTGRQYMPIMNKGRLDIIEKGKRIAEYELDPKTTIIDASYGESIESSINQVKIYDENNKYVGIVKLDGVPGILQDIYKQEKGENANQRAKAMLKGIEQTASINAIGDFDCISGSAVVVKEPITGLSGLFYIENDEHTFENGQHSMSLGLAFKNLMDRQEGGGGVEDG